MQDLQGQKHTVKCRCILPQFKNRKDPLLHEFVVFSTFTDSVFNESFAQCNNCGVVHRVYDLCRSEIIDSKEELRSVQTKADIVISMPDSLVSLLESCNADLATYQEVSFVLENNLTDKKILLEKEIIEDYVTGKFLSVNEAGKMKVEPFNYQSSVKRG